MEKHAGEPATGGFTRWKHVVLHGIRLEEEHSFRETANRLKYMSDIREVLELEKGDVPEYTTLNKSFDRGHASAHYLDRSNRTVETMKVTTPTDTASLAVLDVQCHAQWRHDTKTGPQVVRRRGRPAYRRG